MLQSAEALEDGWAPGVNATMSTLKYNTLALQIIPIHAQLVWMAPNWCICMLARPTLHV